MDSEKKADWGELLYEPDWAKRSRFRSPFSAYAALALAALGLGMMVYLPWGWPSWDLLATAILVWFLAVIGACTATAMVVLARALRRMPPRVYRRGLTLNRVPLLDGLMGRATLVPWEDVLRVDLERPVHNGIETARLLVEVDAGAGGHSAMRLDASDIDDPLRLIDALCPLVPGKVGLNLVPIVDADVPISGVPPDIIAEDVMYEPSSSSIEVFLILIILLMSLLVATLSSPFQYIGSVLYLALAALSIWGLVMFERVVLEPAIPAKARLEGGHVRLPDSRDHVVFLEMRRSIPIQEIREVQEVLEPVFYGRQGTLLTTGGERLNVGHRFMRSIDENEDFERRRHLHANRGPLARPGPPLMRLRRDRVGLVGSIFALVSLALVALESGAVMDTAINAMVFVGVPAMMASLFITIGREGWKVRVSTRLRADEKHIRMPTLRRRFREIPRREVLSIRTRPEMALYGLEVTTERGSLRLSNLAVKELLLAGYQIEDEAGCLDSEDVEETRRQATSGMRRAEVSLGPKALRRGDLGEVVAVESRDGVRERGKEGRLRVGQNIIILVLLGGMLLTMPPGMFDDMWIILLMFCILLGLAIVGVADFIITLIRARPITVRAKGVEIPKGASRTEHVPWGSFEGYGLVDGEGGRQELRLERREARKRSVIIDSRFSGWEDALATVRRSVGVRAEATVETEVVEGGASSAPEGNPRVLRQAKRGKLLQARAKVMGQRGVLLVGPFMGMFLIGLLIMPGMDMYNLALSDFVPELPEVPADPGPGTLAAGSYSGGQLNVSGSIAVHAGDELSLRDLVLAVSPGPDNRSVIWVGAGGNLSMENVTVVPASTNMTFDIVIMGMANISRCDLGRHLPLEERGIGYIQVEVRSDAVHIVDSTLDWTEHSSIMTVDCSPRIERCHFARRLGYGVVSLGGRPRVANSTFESVENSIHLYRSDALIEDCMFNDSYIAVDLSDSSPRINRCTFRGCWAAIETTPRCDPVLEGNLFIGNAVDVYKDMMGMMVLTMMYVMMPSMALFFLVLSWREDRKGRKGDALRG